MLVNALTAEPIARILSGKYQESEMDTDKTETSWNHFLNRIRNLWKPAPQGQPVPAAGPAQPVSHNVGPIGTPRSFAD